MRETHRGKNDILEVLGINQQNTGKKIPKLWLIATVIIIAMGGVMLKSRAKTAPVQYKTQMAIIDNFTITVTATGTLQPTNRVDVSSELSGIIKDVYVDYNDRVKAGEPLAALNTNKLEAQVKQSKASLSAAEAKVHQAQATLTEASDKLAQYKKLRKLSNNKVPSASDMKAALAVFERANADLASANAQVLEAEATLQANQTDLSKAIIRSPIDGVILSRSVEPGQTVAASFRAPVLFSLAENLTQMELHVNVDEADIGKIQTNQKATFTVSAYPNRMFNAYITKSYYGASTTAGVVTYETILKVANSDLSLRPGMTATATITVKEVANALLIPSAALRFMPDLHKGKEEESSKDLVGSLMPPPQKRYSMQDVVNFQNSNYRDVWVVMKGKLKKIHVTIGETNDILTEIKAGDIRPGQHVVIDTLSMEM